MATIDHFLTGSKSEVRNSWGTIVYNQVLTLHAISPLVHSLLQTIYKCVCVCDILNCTLSVMCHVLLYIRVFPKIDDSGNIGNKDLGEGGHSKLGESKINSAKKLPPVGIFNFTFVGAPINFWT